MSSKCYAYVVEAEDAYPKALTYPKVQNIIPPHPIATDHALAPPSGKVSSGDFSNSGEVMCSAGPSSRASGSFCISREVILDIGTRRRRPEVVQLRVKLSSPQLCSTDVQMIARLIRLGLSSPLHKTSKMGTPGQRAFNLDAALTKRASKKYSLRAKPSRPSSHLPSQPLPSPPRPFRIPADAEKSAWLRKPYSFILFAKV